MLLIFMPKFISVGYSDFLIIYYGKITSKPATYKPRLNVCRCGAFLLQSCLDVVRVKVTPS